MYTGGTLIRCFDGFRRLCRRAAIEFNHPFTIFDEDLLLTNRTLAALGGPPAASEVHGELSSDGLVTLLLFLLTQERECQVGLLGNVEATIAQLKSFVHLFSHALYPIISGSHALSFQEVVKELGPSGAILRPLVTYDQDGEPTDVKRTGAMGRLLVGAEGGPYTLAVLLGEHAGPAPLEKSVGPMHPAVLVLSKSRRA